jgi:hypothetical protein
MWESTWTKFKEYKETIKRIEENIPEELNFKDAFFGGRTNEELRVGHPIKILKLATYVRP